MERITKAGRIHRKKNQNSQPKNPKKIQEDDFPI